MGPTSGCGHLRQRRDFLQGGSWADSRSRRIRYRQASARASAARPMWLLLSCRQSIAPALDPQRSRAAFPCVEVFARCLSPRRPGPGVRARAATPRRLPGALAHRRRQQRRIFGDAVGHIAVTNAAPAPFFLSRRHDDQSLPSRTSFSRDKQIAWRDGAGIQSDTPSQDHAADGAANLWRVQLLFCCP